MYERFTDQARKVMQLANQEAQRLNHEYIGTEHILLGLVAERSGVAARALRKLGIDLKQVRRELQKIILPGPDIVTSGKLPQTPKARKVIELAWEEAIGLNQGSLDTEHLLLGIIRESDNVAAQILLNLGVRFKAVREEVLKLSGSPEIEPIRTNPKTSFRIRDIDRIEYTDRARKVMLLAAEEAYNFGHTYIGPEHILLGIYREGTSSGIEILINEGMSEPRVREEIQNILLHNSDLKGSFFQLSTAAVDSVQLAGLKCREGHVDADHLLFGVLVESETLSSHCERVMTHLFQNFGIDASSICDELRFRLGEGAN